MLPGFLQTALDAVFPPACLICGEPVQDTGALCGACWGETPFLSGAGCVLCGAPLAGPADDAARCDDCLELPRPWQAGRAALLYADRGRELVLKLKHGDRHDIAQPAARWMARAGAGLIRPETLIVPVPLHRWRLLRRRYNQSALLAQALSRLTGATCCTDALRRRTATPPLEGKGRAARFDLLADAIEPNPARLAEIAGRKVLIVDDVMTSGATFAAATEACLAAGAQQVCVLALARVAPAA